MFGLEIPKEVIVSFLGTILALISAGLVWLLKLAYEKHRAETRALAKYERMFALNMTLLKDNFEFIGHWANAIQQDRPYSFHFDAYFLNEEETYQISNLGLVKQILSLNYKLKRTNLDLQNLYKSYWDVVAKIDSIPEEEQREKNLKIYHATVLKTLEQLKKNYEPLKTDLINAVALIRVVANIRYHSLFGYLSLFFKDIYPRQTEKALDEQIKILKENIERNEKAE